MRKFGLLCVCLLFFCGKSVAGDGDDFGIWTFFGVNTKLSKVFTFYSEAELRTRENVGAVDCWSLYGEISARICPYLKLGTGYTYIDYNHPALLWESRHRINGFVLGSYTTGPWYFAVRERYEQVHRILTDKSAVNPAAKRTLRSRAECNYKFPRSRFTPYVTVELYTGLNTAQGATNDKIRYTLGTMIAVGKHNYFSLYYRYVDLLQSVPGNSHILGMGFRFNL